MTALYIILAIFIFGFLIFIHELGHFITAKLCGVRVNEFAINMGPRLFGWKKGETQYSFRLIPIGGYCAMEGEDEATGDPRAFTSAKWWKKLIILCAGAFMNLLTGYLVMVLLFAFADFSMQKTTVTGFMTGNTVEEQGLQLGDTLYALNGKRIWLRQDFDLLEGRIDGSRCELTVLRDGEKVVLHDFDLTRKQLTDEDGNTGMYLGFYMRSFAPRTVGNVLKYAGWQCIDFTRMVWYGLQDLFTGKAGLKDVGGVARVVDVMVQSGTQAPSVMDGIENVLYLGAFIAVNLAVMNMLPIPALDGGRVLFLLIGTVFTAITGKKINPKYEGWIHGVTMILLLGLMAFLFVKDIVVIAGR